MNAFYLNIVILSCCFIFKLCEKTCFQAYFLLLFFSPPSIGLLSLSISCSLLCFLLNENTQNDCIQFTFLELLLISFFIRLNRPKQLSSRWRLNRCRDRTARRTSCSCHCHLRCHRNPLHFPHRPTPRVHLYRRRQMCCPKGWASHAR